MSDATLATLAMICAASVLSPVLADLVPGALVPAVVIEILFGIAIGPYGLDFAAADPVISVLAGLGLATLMFLAGYELDFGELRGPLRVAIRGWCVTLVLALGIGYVMARTGEVHSGLLVGLALTSTSLSTILPVLADSGALNTPFGTRVLAIGSAGEFGPILAVALLLGSDSPALTVVLLAAFISSALVAARLALRPHPARLVRLATATLGTSGQLAVRIAVAMLVGLVWLAARLTLDTILGAFTAGMVFRLYASAGEPVEREVVEGKIKAMGFGFLIPLFFVVTGMRFDFQPFVDRPASLLLVLGYLLAILVVRGLPVLLLHRHDDLTAGERHGMALLASTALPIIVVVTTIGTSTGRMSVENSSALVGAGMLSVLLFPAFGLRLRSRGVSGAGVLEVGPAPD